MWVRVVNQRLQRCTWRHRPCREKEHTYHLPWHPILLTNAIVCNAGFRCSPGPYVSMVNLSSKLNIILCKLCLWGDPSQVAVMLWAHCNGVYDASYWWFQQCCTDRSDMVIPLGETVIISILMAIIVIVKVTAVAMLADILCLWVVDDAYSPFTAHGYWIPQPYLCF